MSRNILKLALMTSAATMIITGNAAAQQLDSIVVTAQKREENILDVPVAVTAYDAATLRKEGIQEIDDLQFTSPSFNITIQQNVVANIPVRIRGVGTTGTNPSFEGSVGVYLDDTYRSRAGMALATFNDIGAVELLRGPQGTLFGKNTAAGAIILRSNKPSFETEAGGEFTVGNYGKTRVNGFVNAPLNEELAARVSVVRDKRDGFFESPTGVAEDVNEIDQVNVKSQLLWEPTDNFSAHLIADYGHADENFGYGISTRIENGSPAAEAFYAGLAAAVGQPWYFDITDPTQTIIDPFQRRNLTNRTPNSLVNDYGGVLTLNYDVNDSLSVKSISNWRFFDYEHTNTDLDFGPHDIGASIDEFFFINTFSQEFNVSGTFDDVLGGVNYLLGGFYTNEDIDYRRLIDNPASQTALNWAFLYEGALGLVDVQGFGVDGPAPLFTLANGGPLANGGLLSLADTTVPQVHQRFLQNNEVLAFFAHAEIALSEQFIVVGGVRYNSETKDVSSRNLIFPGDPDAYAAYVATLNGGAWLLGASTSGVDFDSDIDEDEITWDVALQYFPTENIQLYAKIAKGFKAGGVSFNPDAGGGNPTLNPLNPFDLTFRNATRDPAYNPETVLSYEAGIKGSYLDGRGRGSITGFYQDFEDIQFSVFTGTAFETFNASEAVSAGIEIENSFAVTDELQINSSLTWLIDATYGDDLVDPARPTFLAGLPGRRFTHAPKIAASASAYYERPISENLVGFLNTTVAYMGEHFIEIELSNVEDGYAVAGMSGGIASADGRWRIEGWVRNLTDAEYFEIGFNQPLTFTGNAVMANLGEPRTFGGTISVNF